MAMDAVRREAKAAWAAVLRQVLSQLSGPGPGLLIAELSAPWDLRSCLQVLPPKRRKCVVASLLAKTENEEEDHPKRAVRREVVDLLLESGKEAAVHAEALASVLLLEDPPLCSKAIRVLKTLGSEGAKHVAPLLGDEDARFDAVDVLQSLGQVAEPFVEPLLQHACEDVRVVADRLLARLHAGRCSMGRPKPSLARQETAGSSLPQKRKMVAEDDVEYIDDLLKAAADCVKRSKPLLEKMPKLPDPPAERPPDPLPEPPRPDPKAGAPAASHVAPCPPALAPVPASWWPIFAHHAWMQHAAHHAAHAQLGFGAPVALLNAQLGFPLGFPFFTR
ncbi:unnamed protein product [Effrenium voratum]|uniref:Uncharacterized protein n=1 Tax=Effrenium voratum TaxID=2562239 RepID=A0AA36I9V7_9DINO|nr:unnamed protein product [Effrenium voratum]